MRILAQVHGYPLGHCAGAEWMLHYMLAYLVGRGHECRVICGPGSRGVWTGVLDGVSVEDEARVAQLDAYEWADVVVTHLDRCRDAIKLAREVRRPLVHIVHNGDYLAHHRVRQDEATMLVMNSLHLAKALRWPGPQLLLHPPVPVNRYRMERKHPPRFVTLLNLNANKGASTFYEVARLMPELPFLGVRGAYGDQVVPRQLPANVTVVPCATDVRPILAATRVLLMPSASETWGRTAVEAACSGVPTIAHPAAGLVEALGEAALWCRREAPHQWVQAIRSLDDPARYAAHSTAAARRAVELERRVDRQLEALEGALLSLCSGLPRVDAYCSMVQFADHAGPVLSAIPAEVRGTMICHPAAVAPMLQAGHVVASYANDAEVAVRLKRDCGPVLVSASGDMGHARQSGRAVVLMEHGAGQTYAGLKNPSYAGGPGRAGLKLIIVPGRRPGDLTRAAYPEVPCVEVGCPKLDGWLGRSPDADHPVVALAWHWDCGVMPETRSAFVHYRDALSSSLIKQMRERGWHVLGHAHPRWIRELEPWYRAMQVEVVLEFSELLRRASVLVCDNSSIIFEFAAIGRPVVVLNAPWYRRGVQHGMRFWEHADLGPQVDQPAQLIPAIERALADPPEVVLRRRAVSADVYSHLDGTSAWRAAAAVIEHAWEAVRPKQQEGPIVGVEMEAIISFVGKPDEAVAPNGLVPRGAKFVAATPLRARQLKERGLAFETGQATVDRPVADASTQRERSRMLEGLALKIDRHGKPTADVTKGGELLPPPKDEADDEMPLPGAAGYLLQRQASGDAADPPDVKVSDREVVVAGAVAAAGARKKTSAEQFIEQRTKKTDKKKAEAVTEATGVQFTCSFCKRGFGSPGEVAIHQQADHQDRM